MYEKLILITTKIASISPGELNLPDISPEIILKNITNIFLIVIGIVAVVSIVYSAIMMIGSNGNSEKVANARRMLIWSVVGLIIAILAEVIVNVVVGAI